MPKAQHVGLVQDLSVKTSKKWYQETPETSVRPNSNKITQMRHMKRETCPVQILTP